MRIDKRVHHNNGYDITIDGDETIRPAVAIATVGGLSVTVTTLSLMLWGTLSILNAQEAISWTLEWWQHPALSGLYLVFRALNKVLWK